MSIRIQVALALLLMCLLFAATTHAITQIVLLPSIAKLEGDFASRDVQRCHDAIQAELAHLSNLARDWASWDDAYAYVADRNPQFEQSNLTPDLFANSNINLLAITDSDGQIVWRELRDHKHLALLDSPRFDRLLAMPDHRLTHHAVPEACVEGVFVTRHGPLLLASRPILTSKRQGPIRGSIVMGRFLDSQAIQNIATQTHVTLQAWPVLDGQVPESERPFVRALDRREDIVVHPQDTRTLSAYSLLKDVNGSPAVLLRADLDRTMMAKGENAARFATLSNVIGGLIILSGTYVVLRHAIITPIVEITEHVLRVGDTGDLSARMETKRSDEIGTLAREFNAMVERLADSHERVVETAHQAGMAEIATDVLHNVGNAINSANVSSEMLENRLHDSRVAGLRKATMLLEEQRGQIATFLTADARGPKLLDYLSSLAAMLQEEHNDNVMEVGRLRDTIRHIRDVIATQQAYAGGPDFKQEVQFSDMVEDILRLHEPQFQQHHITVQRHYETLPTVMLNKTKLMQIATNLVKNAIEAILANENSSRQLRIVITKVEDDVLLEVVDSGVGISPENLCKIFCHGFTTKATGHGFGLHYCANAATEMGGSIRVTSDGVGQGATFALRLPQGVSEALQLA
ncbi:MAG: HAMP domain-containing protein [Planctomycetales bacterium]|nr:HAMP domain-containing protein [Planctomycetales bacterium]